MGRVSVSERPEAGVLEGLPAATAATPMSAPIRTMPVVGEAWAAPVRICGEVWIGAPEASAVIVGVIVVWLRVIGPRVVGGRCRHRALDIRAGSIRTEISGRRGGWREREEGGRG